LRVSVVDCGSPLPLCVARLPVKKRQRAAASKTSRNHPAGFQVRPPFLLNRYGPQFSNSIPKLNRAGKHRLKWRRASRPAVEPDFQPGGGNRAQAKLVNGFWRCEIIFAFFPRGRMPPSTSGRMPDATPQRICFPRAFVFLAVLSPNFIARCDDFPAM